MQNYALHIQCIEKIYAVHMHCIKKCYAEFMQCNASKVK